MLRLDVRFISWMLVCAILPLWAAQAEGRRGRRRVQAEQSNHVGQTIRPGTTRSLINEAVEPQGDHVTREKVKTTHATFLGRRLVHIEYLAYLLFGLLQSCLFWLLFRPNITWVRSWAVFVLSHIVGVVLAKGSAAFLPDTVTVASAVALTGVVVQCLVAIWLMPLHGRGAVAVTVVAVSAVGLGVLYGLVQWQEPALGRLTELWFSRWLFLYNAT